MASVAGPADCGQDSEDDDGYILVDAGAGANLDGANPAAQLSIESAAITEYREEEEYGEYRMELVHQGLPTVVHWLRYKQYERLHKMLKKHFKSYDFGFPKSTAGGVRGSIRKGLNKVTGGMQLGKKLGGTGGDSFVTHRLEGLDAFIGRVAANKTSHGVLQTFLAEIASSADASLGTVGVGEEKTEDAAAIERIDSVLEDLREFLDIAPLPDGLELADELEKLDAESIQIPADAPSSPESPPSDPVVGRVDTALGPSPGGAAVGEEATVMDSPDRDRSAGERSSPCTILPAKSSSVAESAPAAAPTPVAGDTPEPAEPAASKSQAIAGYLTSRSKGSNPFALEMMAMDRQTEVFAPLPVPLLEHFLAYLVKQEELQLEALHNVFRRRTKAVQARLDELEAQEEYHAHKRSSGPLDEVPPAADTSGVGGDITPPGLPGESTNGAASPEDGYVSVGSSPSSVTRDSPLADASGLSPTVVIRRPPNNRKDTSPNRGTVWFPQARGDEQAAAAATPALHAAPQMRMLGSASSAPAEHRSTLWDPLRIPETGESTTTPSPVRIAMPPPPPPPEGAPSPRRTTQL